MANGGKDNTHVRTEDDLSPLGGVFNCKSVGNYDDIFVSLDLMLR